MTIARRAFASACLVLALTRGARAHAVVKSAQPEHGSTIRPGAIAVVLNFNTRIDRARSRLTLTNPAGRSTPLQMRADSTASALRADATATAAGQWRLRWQVLAADGHITRGDIVFTVAAS